MKKKAILCLTLSAVLLLLFAAGCSSEEDKKPPADDNGMQDDNTPGDDTTNDKENGGETSDDPMTTLRGLVGKADEDLVKAFGEGEAVMENAVTTGRRYTMNILGEEMPVHVMLDEKGNVLSADAELPDADEERWNREMTDMFGEPGMDNDRPQWVKDGMIYAIEKENDRLLLRMKGEKIAE